MTMVRRFYMRKMWFYNKIIHLSLIERRGFQERKALGLTLLGLDNELHRSLGSIQFLS